MLSNRRSIQEILGITSGDVISDNPFFQRKTSKQLGCQIDYMIQTKFNTLYICEIKFSKNLISMDVIAEVQEKIQRLKCPKGFSYRPVLLHVNGVTDDLASSHYFAAIIDLSQLWLS